MFIKNNIAKKANTTPQLVFIKLGKEGNKKGKADVNTIKSPNPTNRFLLSKYLKANSR